MDSSGVDAFGGMLILCCYGFLCLLSLAGFAFWIWMLVDLLQRSFPVGQEQEKTTWLIILILTGLIGLCMGFPWIGALIYYITVKRKYDNMTVIYTDTPPVQSPPPAEGDKMA